MENTNNVPNSDNQVTGGERTFTQAEVDNIIGTRLHKERQKLEGDITEREKAVAQREFQAAAADVLKSNHADNNTDNPFEILSILNATTADELDKALKTLQKAFGVSYEEMGTSPATPIKTAPNHNEDAAIRKAMGLKK